MPLPDGPCRNTICEDAAAAGSGCDDDDDGTAAVLDDVLWDVIGVFMMAFSGRGCCSSCCCTRGGASCDNLDD